MSEVIGVKHDGGKPWAGTVLAGFWPRLGDEFGLACAQYGALSTADIGAFSETLDAFFDVSLAIPDRLVKAAAHLTSFVSTAAYLPHVIEVGTYGARKYDRDNWLHVEGGVERYYEAVGRHVRDVMLGDWRDEESGCVNLGHIVWGILAGAELVRRAQPKSEFHEHDFTGVGGTQPALKLPLEVGNTYRVYYRGAYVCELSGYKDHDGNVMVGDWCFRSSDGLAPGVEDSVTLQGPVSP
jgi:hypothetical protein